LADKNDVLMVAAGYNHSIALTKNGKFGKIFSWGYNGKGVLGR
jgi:alpha-tubulin suppressor-like RCC1 family protein